MLLLPIRQFSIRRRFWLFDRHIAEFPGASRIFMSTFPSVISTKQQPSFEKFHKPYHQLVLPQKQIWRNFYVGFYRTVDFYAKDKVDKNDYRLVYNSPVENYIIYAQLIVDVTSLMALSSVLFHVYSYFSGEEVKLAYGMITTNVQGLISYAFFIVFNVAIVVIYSRIVLRIYYCEDRDEFLIVFKPLFKPFGCRKINCKSGDMKQYRDVGTFGVTSQYIIGKQKVALHELHFIYPLYYNKLLGIGKEFENKD